MTFLADENIDVQIVERLRLDGHVVLSVAEMEPGITDENVLALANRKDALLITADKEFGELVFRQNRIHTGVLLIRMSGLPAEKKAAYVAIAVQKHLSEIIHCFSVVSPGMLRIHPR